MVQEMTDNVAGDRTTEAVLTVGESLTSSIDSPTDVDWFRVDLSAGQGYRFSVLGVDGELTPLHRPSILLADRDGLAISAAVSPASGHAVELEFVAFESATYFISVADSDRSNPGSYSLTAIETDLVDDVPGTINSDRSLEIGETATGSIDFQADEDWYKVALTRGTQYIIELNGNGAIDDRVQDPVLFLYDSKENLFGFNGIVEDSSSARIVFRPLTTGDYFISASAGDAFGNYLVSIDATPLDRNDVVNGVDIGEAPELLGAIFVRSEIVGDTVIIGSLGYESDLGGRDDQDVFTFKAPGSGTATFELRDFDGELNLSLRDAQFQLLAEAMGSESGQPAFITDVVRGELYSVTVEIGDAGDTLYRVDLEFDFGLDATIEGTAGDDTLQGSAEADIILGLSGDDVIDGSEGADIALYLGNAGDFRFGTRDGALTITDTNLEDGDDGSDWLINVETLQFADRDLGSSWSAEGRPQIIGATIDDRIAVSSGGLHVFGNLGRDVVLFDGDSEEFVFAIEDDSVVVTSLSDEALSNSTVRLTDVEILEFSDRSLLAVGGEFRVNSTTEGDQGNHDIAALTGGGYVVAWLDTNAQTLEQRNLAQLYGADGTPIGGELLLQDVAPIGHLYPPRVASTGDGGFIAVWPVADDSGNGNIVARLFDAFGHPVTDPMLVSEPASLIPVANFFPDVARLDIGEYVVSWSTQTIIDVNGNGSFDNTDVVYQVQAKRLGENGEALGEIIAVSSDPSADALSSSVVALPDGGFAVGWAEIVLRSTIVSSVRQFDANGIPRSDAQLLPGPDELVVESDFLEFDWIGDIRAAFFLYFTLASQYRPSLATLSDGSLIVLSDWLEGRDLESGEPAVYLDKFAPGATRPSATVRVESDVETTYSSMAVLGNDDIVVVWQNDFSLDDAESDDPAVEGFGKNIDVFSRRYSSDFNPLAEQSVVNTTSFGAQAVAAISALETGGYLVAWSAIGQDLDAGGVYAQQFAQDGEVIRISVRGTDGSDVLFHVGPESMRAEGFGGDDIYIVVRREDEVIEQPGEGVDTVNSTVTRSLEANVENLLLAGEDAVDATGNELSNLLVGNGASNELLGLNGDDVLDGGAGADVMRGGSGADTYFVDNDGDLVIESSGTELLSVSMALSVARPGSDDIDPQDVADDIDQVVATISYALTDFVENLTLSGTENIDGTGNTLDNVIIGNNSGNTLTSGQGLDDRLIGRGGDDRYVVNKQTGQTLIQDEAGGLDRLDLTEFDDGDLSIGASGDTLIIENSIGGLVAVYGFFASGDAPINEVSVNAGQVVISELRDTASLALALGGDDAGELASIVDDDGNLFDSSILTLSGDEVTSPQAQLFRTYAGALGRTPDDGGYTWWLEQIALGNHDLRSMAAGFIFSDEFIGFFEAADGNSIDNADFVNHMYVNVFGREPDQGGFDFWFGELESGNRSQVDVLVEMTQSNEYVQLTVFAAVDYLVE